MKKIVSQLIALGGLIAFFLLLLVIRMIPSAADFYVRYISSNYFMIWNFLFGWIPFSFYEIVLILLIVCAIIMLVRIFISLIRRRFLTSLSRFLLLIIVSVTCADCYFATASVSYGRSAVPVPQYEDEVTRELIDSCFEYYLRDYNAIAETFDYDSDGLLIAPHSFEETNALLKTEFEKLDAKYYNPYTGSVSRLLLSPVFSELHITGVTFAPIGDISVNAEMPAASLPHTMAHEIAHSKGVAREDDANLVGLYVCLMSEDPYLRYSAYTLAFSSLLEIYALTDYSAYVSGYFSLHESIRDEYAAVRAFWSAHNTFARIGNWFNDLFLKANGNSNGTDDYTDSSDSTDTGETDENDHPIYVIDEYSPYQKLFFQYFISLRS